MKNDLLLESFGDFSITRQDMNQTNGGQSQAIVKYMSSTCPCYMIISDSGTSYYTMIGAPITASDPDNDFVAFM